MRQGCLAIGHQPFPRPWRPRRDVLAAHYAATQVGEVFAGVVEAATGDRPGTAIRVLATAYWQLVPQCSTGCYDRWVSGYQEVTQRDLRTKSRQIMDAIEHGQSFTVTRDGRRIGELIPLRNRRRFVPRQEFVAMSRNAPAFNLSAFRADQDIALDHQAGDVYGR